MSQLVAERGGFDLLPETGFKPVNKYLPPRPRRDATTTPAVTNGAVANGGDEASTSARFFAWADKMLSR